MNNLDVNIQEDVVKETSSFAPKIRSVKDILSHQEIIIPPYQRPYKWSVKNVNQLIDDLLHFKDKPAYRLGTIVYHRENDKLNLVDGQQRSVTLALITLAIQRDERLSKLARTNRFSIPENTALTNFRFTHTLSKENIRTNYHEIKRRLVDFDYKSLVFLFHKCEVVQIVLTDISEAFQFFDSQNARGKDLDPHDLLKAFHLRELDPKTTEKEVKELVAKWEGLDSRQLAQSFSEYLFRIRYWSKGKSARFFTKKEVDEFKGISPTVSEPFPYARMYKIAHHYVEGYNAEYHRKIDENYMIFPFQIDQAMINGQRFFEYVDHYDQLIEEFVSKSKYQKWLDKNSIALQIFDTINSYTARGRTGDKYARNLFDTALIYYIDKFGKVELERAIEKIFIWAYSLRLRRQSVQLASMDNHALEYPFIFKSLKEALSPSQFLNIGIPVINENEYSASNQRGKLQEIVNLFKSLNYVK